MEPKNPLSTDELLKKAQECLKDRPAGSVKAEIPEATFWLETRNLLNVTEEHTKIEDVSKIQPNSKIDIELTFVLGLVTYRFTIKTIVTEGGLFQLRHPELTGFDYPEVSQSVWKELAAFAKQNAVSIASLLLSLLNTALKLMELKGPS